MLNKSNKSSSSVCSKCYSVIYMTHYIDIACEKKRGRRGGKQDYCTQMSTSDFALGYSFAGISSLWSHNYTYAPEAITAALAFSWDYLCVELTGGGGENGLYRFTEQQELTTSILRKYIQGGDLSDSHALWAMKQNAIHKPCIMTCPMLDCLLPLALIQDGQRDCALR